MLVAAAGAPLVGPVRDVLALSFAPPPPGLARLLALWAHNTPIAAWPLLLTPLGAHRRNASRRLADLTLAACMLANALPVGAAIAAYGSRLVAYLPQMPIEWAGLACGPAWWIAARRRAPGGRAALAWGAATCALMLAAASIETYLAGRA